MSCAWIAREGVPGRTWLNAIDRCSLKHAEDPSTAQLKGTIRKRAAVSQAPRG